MRKLVVANHKANLSMSDIGDYIFNINTHLNDKHNIVICPSYIHIPFFTSEKFELGAQDVSIYDNGSYTGEITSEQLKSSNVKYVIVGHSERRELFDEREKIINLKLKQCFKNDLIPILCVGETKEDKLSNRTSQIIRRSLLETLNGFSKEDLSKLVIAYEPIWSIGTGITPTIKEIEEIISFIKDIIRSAYKVEIKVLYGGSVKESNIDKLKEVGNLDGFLIGGASNNAVVFSKIGDML